MLNRLNAAPEYLFSIMNFDYNIKRISSAFPAEAYFHQDKDYAYYNHKVTQVYIYQSDQVELEISWQVRQAYRFINTVLSSDHFSLTPYKQALNQAKYFLEQQNVISNIDYDIKHGHLKPDVILSGHGGWEEKDGYVDFSGQSAIVMYSPIGASISFPVGCDIENNWMHDVYQVINVKNTADRQTCVKHVYNASSQDTLPNFAIYARNGLKARLIESMTGRILMELGLHQKEISISLQQVMQLYPNRIIHFSGCASLFNNNHELIGNYKDALVKRGGALCKPTKFQFFQLRYGWAERAEVSENANQPTF